MITPLLEKAILKGLARVEYVSHAHGMFGRIPVAAGKIAVITKITWWPFINSQSDGTDPGTNTWNIYLRYSEYQLKIDSGKGTHYFPFRNSIKIQNMDNTQTINLDAPIVPTDQQFILMQPGEPVIQDVYIPLEEFCKLTVSRNCTIDETASAYGQVTNKANERIAPEGVADLNVLLSYDTTTPGGQQYTYSPPSEELTGLDSADPNKKYPYTNPIYKAVAGGLFESELSPSGTNGLLMGVVDNPLVTFEVVYINKNIADLLQNS